MALLKFYDNLQDYRKKTYVLTVRTMTRINMYVIHETIKDISVEDGQLKFLLVKLI